LKLVDGYGQLLTTKGDTVAFCEYHETWEGADLLEGYLSCRGRREDYPAGTYLLRRQDGRDQAIRVEGYPAWVDSPDMPAVTIAFTALVAQGAAS
jgi:hypothetical protein